MTWVKICGMTNLEDALVAVEAGADAVGFVFYEKSPRCVSVEVAREIVGKLPESVEKIGVFVGSDEDPIDVLLQTGLTGTQCYISAEGVAGSNASNKATSEDCLPPHFRSLIAFPMSFFGEDVSQVEGMAADFGASRKKMPEGVSIPDGFLDTLLLDSGNLRQPGGTGHAFDWKKARTLAEGMRKNGLKLVVAGGLTPENVGEAISILQPWGVDVASGVEASPGKKDAEKVRAFVRAVREMDGKTG
ncbi:MAG: phosphoribosylanthranilate isomerase [Candidatus Sulfotelmatobacter sp.]